MSGSLHQNVQCVAQVGLGAVRLFLEIRAFVGFSWRPLSSSPRRKLVTKACVTSSVGPRLRAKRSGPGGLLVVPSFARELLWAEQDKTVIRVAQVKVPGQAWRHSSTLQKKTGSVDLVERVLQIHGQEASFVVVVVCLEPSSAGVDDGLTAVLVFRISCHVLATSSQQSFRCWASKNFSYGRWPLAAVLWP